jgi:hypothetical protein
MWWPSRKTLPRSQPRTANRWRGATSLSELANSDLVSRFQSSAAVGKALEPEKVEAYRKRLGGLSRGPFAFGPGLRSMFRLSTASIRACIGQTTGM